MARSTRSVASGGEEELSLRHKCMKCLVNVTLVIDSVMGLVFLVYGGMISMRYTGGVGFPTFLLAFGSGLVLSTILHVAGAHIEYCRRAGMFFSAWLAIPIAIVYLTAAFYIVFGKEKWSSYMHTHKHELYLSDSQIDSLKNATPALFVLGFFASVLSCCRFYMTLRLRKIMLKMDFQKRSSQSDSLSTPLVSEEAGSAVSDEFLPIDEESLHSDPLWWSKTKSEEPSDLTWAKESV